MLEPMPQAAWDKRSISKPNAPDFMKLSRQLRETGPKHDLGRTAAFTVVIKATKEQQQNGHYEGGGMPCEQEAGKGGEEENALQFYKGREGNH